MAEDSNKDESSSADVKKEKCDSKKEVKAESNAETKPDPAVLAAAAANAAKIKEQKNAEAEVLRDLKAQLKYLFLLHFQKWICFNNFVFNLQESSQRPAWDEIVAGHVQRSR